MCETVRLLTWCRGIQLIKSGQFLRSGRGNNSLQMDGSPTKTRVQDLESSCAEVCVDTGKDVRNAKDDLNDRVKFCVRRRQESQVGNVVLPLRQPRHTT